MADIFLWTLRIIGWAFGAVALVWVLGALLYSLPGLIDPEARRGGGAR